MEVGTTKQRALPTVGKISRVSIDDPVISCQLSPLDPLACERVRVAVIQRLDLTAEVARRVLPPMQLRIFEAQFTLDQEPISESELADELHVSPEDIPGLREAGLKTLRANYQPVIAEIMNERNGSTRAHANMSSAF